MQTTIGSRQIQYNLIVLVSLLVAVALVVGFLAGRAWTVAATASVSPASVRAEPALAAHPQAATGDWAYRHDSVTNKWYAHHYADTSSGPVIDETYEMQYPPAANGCNEGVMGYCAW